MPYLGVKACLIVTDYLRSDTNNCSYLRHMSRYHALRIKKIQPESADCVSVQLELPEGKEAEFNFKPGQHLHCKAIIDGEEVRKSYSICSNPEEEDITIAVKLVYGGKMSTYINQKLLVGDTLDVTTPEGRFTLPEGLSEDATILFFAAGSGITPIISLISFFLKNYPKGNAFLFYSNRSSDSVIFREQLEGLKNEFMTRFTLYQVLTREITGIDILSGRITKEKCTEFGKYFFNPAEVELAYVCGPEMMILDVKAALIEMGLRDDQVKYELFGTHAFTVSSAPKPVIEVEDKISHVTIRMDGHEADFNIPYNGDSVLDIATRAGMDLPFSCKGGVCSTCRALVVEGKMHMDIHYGLEPDEMDAGYVLTCQAHPRSERLILDFDIL